MARTRKYNKYKVKKHTRRKRRKTLFRKIKGKKGGRKSRKRRGGQLSLEMVDLQGGDPLDSKSAAQDVFNKIFSLFGEDISAIKRMSINLGTFMKVVNPLNNWGRTQDKRTLTVIEVGYDNDIKDEVLGINPKKTRGHPRFRYYVLFNSDKSGRTTSTEYKYYPFRHYVNNDQYSVYADKSKINIKMNFYTGTENVQTFVNHDSYPITSLITFFEELKRLVYTKWLQDYNNPKFGTLQGLKDTINDFAIRGVVENQVIEDAKEEARYREAAEQVKINAPLLAAMDQENIQTLLNAIATAKNEKVVDPAVIKQATDMLLQPQMRAQWEPEEKADLLIDQEKDFKKMRMCLYWQNKGKEEQNDLGEAAVDLYGGNNYGNDWVSAWKEGKPRPPNVYPPLKHLKYHNIPIVDPFAYHVWKLSDLNHLLTRQSEDVKNECNGYRNREDIVKCLLKYKVPMKELPFSASPAPAEAPAAPATLQTIDEETAEALAEAEA